MLERLEREGLAPSPEADRATLIRRVSLDLTGLPPTPHEIDDFLNDKSPNAYEKVVDRLLASPRYGERMAFRGWMRRGTPTRTAIKSTATAAWRWRDWVIEAFNRNMPFDQFIVEQLAGRSAAERDAGSDDRHGLQPQPSRSTPKTASCRKSTRSNMSLTAWTRLRRSFWA